MTTQPDPNLSSPTFIYRVVIPHPSRPSVLLLPGEDGWVLPQWELTWIPNRQDISHANESVMETLGLPVRVLRCLYADISAQQLRSEAVYLLENRGSDEAPPAGGCWVGSDGLGDLSLARAEDRALLETWLTERHNANARGRARHKVNVLVPQKGEKRRLVELAGKNARQFMEERKTQIASDQAKAEEAMLELQEALDALGG